MGGCVWCEGRSAATYVFGFRESRHGQEKLDRIAISQLPRGKVCRLRPSQARAFHNHTPPSSSGSVPPVPCHPFLPACACLPHTHGTHAHASACGCEHAVALRKPLVLRLSSLTPLLLLLPLASACVCVCVLVCARASLRGPFARRCAATCGWSAASATSSSRRRLTVCATRSGVLRVRAGATVRRARRRYLGACEKACLHC